MTHAVADWLNGGPWLNLIFLALAIGGVLFGWAASRRIRIPTFSARTYRLVEEKLSKLQQLKILYNDRPIESLSLTRVAIWNRGRLPIEPDDMAPSAQLAVKVTERCKLLGAQIDSVVEPANNFRISSDFDSNLIAIGFDYVSYNDGVVIQVFHTGTSNNDVRVLGTVKDAGPFERFWRDYLFDRTMARLFKWLPELKPTTPRGPKDVLYDPPACSRCPVNPDNDPNRPHRFHYCQIQTCASGLLRRLEPFNCAAVFR